MNINNDDNLSFVIPNNWEYEDNNDSISIYDPEGVGAITISTYSILKIDCSLAEYISQMAVKFINENKIKIDGNFIVDTTNPNYYILNGKGIDTEGWFVKLWIMAKELKIFVITYHSQKKSASELKTVNQIIESIKLTF
jgi:hypothetical protein